MGKGKAKSNGFKVFVQEEFRRMQREGLNPIFNRLFAELGPKFKDLPDEVKQRYKDKATKWNERDDDPKASASYRTTSMPGSSTHQSDSSPPQPQEPQASTSGFNEVSEVKVKMEIGACKRDPEVKQERGEKRSHMELEVYRGPQDQEDEDDPFGERPRKRKPAGYGIPNWKNIKNSTQPDADRYYDYKLFQKRDSCKSIVATRAERVVTTPLYTFSCNVLCKYKSSETDWQFVPIEIGIYAYSIEEGPIGQPYSVIINAGEAPNNYFCDSKDHSKRTHKIGFTKAGNYPREARNDFNRIYKELIKYTKAGERTILVTDNRDIEQVKSCIEWLYARAVEIDESLERMRPSTWTILPLVDFITEAYNYMHVTMLKNPLPKFLLPYELKMRLESSFWDYETEYMCSFHKADDFQTCWCARSCSIRAIKCIEAHIDTIYSMYERAMKPATPEQEEQPPAPTSTSREMTTVQPNQVAHPSAEVARGNLEVRQAVQQRLQPMYQSRI